MAAGPEEDLAIGAVGEIDPAVAAAFGLTRSAAGNTVPRRVGWLEVDLGLLFDEERVPRRITVGGAVSRFPSSDIDLALVVDDAQPADAVAEGLRAAAGDLLESVTLFDVYRGTGISRRARAAWPTGCASAHLIARSPTRKWARLRARCIEAAEREFGAILR